MGDIIGDYRAFAAQQRDRLLVRGIDIKYVHARNLLERHAVVDRGHAWDGRAISLLCED